MQRSTHKTINTQEGTKQHMQRAAQLTGNSRMVHIKTHQHTQDMQQDTMILVLRNSKVCKVNDPWMTWHISRIFSGADIATQQK